MNIEELTKAQIILLTLLVSFVTSIATGIVTVSILDQAPPSVTRTINQVVERTVERVVPDTSKQNASVVTKEVTVVVKEEDLITDSINQNAQSLIRINTLSTSTSTVKEDEPLYLGMGFIVNKEGIVATDIALVKKDSSYQLTLFDGSAYVGKYLTSDGNNFALLKIVKKEDGSPKSLKPVAFTELKALKLGQTVIALSGKERENISIGIISSIIEEEGQRTETVAAVSPNVVTQIDTSLTASVDIGSPLINIFGEVIGIKTSALKRNQGSYTPIAQLNIEDAIEESTE